MEKKEIFGSVLATLLFSGSVIANPNPLTESYDAIEKQRKICFEIAENGHDEFPKSDWLSSLKEPKRTEVLQYLAMTSFHRCLDEKITTFKNELSKQSADIQTFVIKYVAIEPYAIQIPTEIDQVALDKLRSKITKPFQVRKMQARP